ncbi:MAG: hypothetical protein IJX71_01985 [Oscillospiraceae bacterium]|nr:hypothetical protein [Oscillospiraceae bacterium]
MAEFEEKLNQILSSPSAMEQIMALAGSLSGETGTKEQEQAQTQSQTAAPAPSPMAGLGDLFSGIDPGMIMKLLPLLSQLQDQGDEKTRLLEAMKPFLAPERQSRLDQAVRIARLSRLIRSAMTIFQEEGHV